MINPDKLTNKQRERLQKQARRQLAQTDLITFAEFIDPTYAASWHHRLIAEHLEKVERGEITRLIITCPPRTGKSQLVSRIFPAWYIAKNPTRHIISASYGIDITKSEYSMKMQGLMDRDEYAEVFPDFKFGNQRTQEFFNTPEGGAYFATSEGGKMTGKGANLLILDDMLKDRADADSAQRRENIWEWYADVANTRLMYPGAVICMFTRWHHDDLIGRLMQNQPDGWVVLNLPAINDYEPDEQPDYDPRKPGEPLWPLQLATPEERRDPNFDHDIAVQRILASYKELQTMSMHSWASLFQGRPVPKEGGLFQRKWFKHYQGTPEAIAKTCTEIMISVDATLAKKTKYSDKVAMLVAGRQGPNIYILDEIFDKFEFNDIMRAIAGLRHRWAGAGILVEDTAIGPTLIQKLREKFTKVFIFDPKRNSKESRAQTAAYTFECGNIYLPKAEHCPWILDWMEDFAGFPSRKFDDRIDALSQLCIRWEPGQQDMVSNLKRILGIN